MIHGTKSILSCKSCVNCLYEPHSDCFSCQLSISRLEKKLIKHGNRYRELITKYAEKMQETRTFRQSLLEFEREIAYRKKILDDNHNRMRESDESLKKILNSFLIMEKQVSSLRSQLLFIQRNNESPQSPKIMVDIGSLTEEDLESLILELKSQSRSLRQKLSNLKEAVRSPVDSLSLIEASVIGLEDELEDLERRLSQRDNNIDPEIISSLQIGVEALEQQNYGRRLKYEAVIGARLEIEHFSFQAEPSKLASLPPIVENKETEAKLQDQIAAIVEAIQRRQRNIKAARQSIDEMQNAFDEGKGKSEEEWNRKATKLQNLKSDMRNIENSKLAISSIQKANKSLAEESKEKETTVLRLRRIIMKTSRYQEIAKSTAAELLKQAEALRNREERIGEREVRIRKRRETLDQRKNEIDAEDEKLNEFARRVAEIQSQYEDLLSKSDYLQATSKDTCFNSSDSR